MEAPPPLSLKAIQPYLMVSRQFKKRDPVVAYYVMLYYVQQGITISKSDPVAKAYLIEVMDELGQMKEIIRGEDAFSSDMVAQAHIEAVAMKLFSFADGQDRNGQFNRGMIKAFYTSSHLFTTLNQFGDLNEEVEQKMKYGKWKAVEIDRCLKNGITPTPGPPGGDEMGGDLQYGFSAAPPPSDSVPSATNFPTEPARPVPHPRHNLPAEQPAYPPYTSPAEQPAYPPFTSPAQQPTYPPYTSSPAVTPSPVSSYPTPTPAPAPAPQPASAAVGQFSTVQLSPAQISTAQKYCKYASSSLDYEDSVGAMEFLTKAMRLLTTGKDDA